MISTSTVPNPIQITITGPNKSGKYHATYNPPPGSEGYQFPKGTEQGTYVFQVVTPGFEICKYTYTVKKGAKPTITPAPGAITPPTRELTLDFVFGSKDDVGSIKFKFHRDIDDEQFDGDPQVGNDGQT